MISNAFSTNPFVVKLSIVAQWLDARKDHLIETIKSVYVKDRDYIVIKPLDYVKKNCWVNHYKEYLLIPECFQLLVMSSRAKNADTIRSFLVKMNGVPS